MNALLIKSLAQTIYLSMTLPLDSIVEPPVVPDPTYVEPRGERIPTPTRHNNARNTNTQEFTPGILDNIQPGEDPLLGHDTGHPDYSPPEGLGTTGFYRASSRNIWNHAAVDGAGEFRPRVNYVPGEGTFRSFDGRPMPQMRSLPQFWNMGSPIE
jgi:hypothetical protein